MDHIFVYASSDSKNPDKACITSISAIRASGFGPYTKRSIKAAFTSLVDTNFSDVYAALKKSILHDDDKYVVVSHTNEIQRTLLTNNCDGNDLERLFVGRVWIDIAQLAWPVIAMGMIRSRSIADLGKYYGLHFNINEEDTSVIATAITEIYSHMLRRYKAGLVGEEAIRDFGGEALENIRKVIGW